MNDPNPVPATPTPVVVDATAAFEKARRTGRPKGYKLSAASRKAFRDKIRAARRRKAAEKHVVAKKPRKERAAQKTPLTAAERKARWKAALAKTKAAVRKTRKYTPRTAKPVPSVVGGPTGEAVNDAIVFLRHAVKAMPPPAKMSYAEGLVVAALRMLEGAS